MHGSAQIDRDARKMVARMRDTDKADREWENMRRRQTRKVARRQARAGRQAMTLAAAMEDD